MQASLIFAATGDTGSRAAGKFRDFKKIRASESASLRTPPIGSCRQLPDWQKNNFVTQDELRNVARH